MLKRNLLATAAFLSLALSAAFAFAAETVEVEPVMQVEVEQDTGLLLLPVAETIESAVELNAPFTSRRPVMGSILTNQTLKVAQSAFEVGWRYSI
ncbi:MAG: hypothetical protein ABNH21_06715 [Glaciecola sp.]|jgi:hypothetical protein